MIPEKGPSGKNAKQTSYLNLIPKAMLRVPDISPVRVAGFADHIKAAPGIAETPDAREIIAVVNRAYNLMGTAARTFDASDFPSVFIDTPDANLSRSQKKAIKQILGVEAADGAGYLTCMLAYYGAWEKGATQLEAAILKAKAENREITTDELKAITEANRGRVPAPRREDPMYNSYSRTGIKTETGAYLPPG